MEFRNNGNMHFDLYENARKFAKKIIPLTKGETHFQDCLDDYWENGENTGDYDIYIDGKFVRRSNTNNKEKQWDNIVTIYKDDYGFILDFKCSKFKKQCDYGI